MTLSTGGNLKLDAIPVTSVVAGEPSTGLSGNAAVLLREISERVSRLADADETSMIDLLAMPLTASDLVWLREQLGTGEISITLDADGESFLRETSFPGVWWVMHHNLNGGVLSAFIEIAPVPELAKAHKDDVRGGLERLQHLIFDSN